jgi:ketosteroid isomerase-like protein
MSQENVEIVKAIWPQEVDVVELAQRPQLPSQVAAAIDPDAEIVFMSDAPGVPNPTYRGIAGLAEGWRDWLEPYESYRLEVEDFIDAGSDRVLVPARVQARTRRDGVLVEHFPAAVCTIRDGRLAQVTFHLDRHQALEAVELQE